MVTLEDSLTTGYLPQALRAILKATKFLDPNGESPATTFRVSALANLPSRMGARLVQRVSAELLEIRIRNALVSPVSSL